ncbi:hypothetical protein [Phascolarctobacterium sp.]|uniref:hypothetical protein n=1 Tax=Phascolarctobacterium sp. TaxID=2049039 RepID=UPI0025F8CDB0|nr:hypothetical protein [Phascolarctobacterium sp.]
MRSFFTLVLVCFYCIYVIPAFADEVIISEPGVMITYSPELHNKSQMVFRKYNFSLSQPARVRLNFKSNIDNKVSIKLIETETENSIEPFKETIVKRSSPCNIEADLSAKAYTFLVLQHRPIGSVNNTGTYSFVMNTLDESVPVVEKTVTVTSTPAPKQQIIKSGSANNDNSVKQGSDTNETSKQVSSIDKQSEKTNINSGDDTRDLLSLVADLGTILEYCLAKKWVILYGVGILAILLKPYL